MSDYEAPKPQSILHQIGRLGSKMYKPLKKNKSARDDDVQESAHVLVLDSDGVLDENGIFHGIDASGHEDFSSVTSQGDYEDNLIEDMEDTPLPQATEDGKCDGNSQKGKDVSNDASASRRSSNKSHRRSGNSLRIDTTGEMF
ncbi:unnamed protein product [Cylindrotheca closterium]|uniref:Uncharacterized protein n=1 Tax=Cylindrotheca closterium TaxID=2856 RepID=A0AAD2JN62_9STRA|nr:unnamed protein product [Cylindrotheca closterium]